MNTAPERIWAYEDGQGHGHFYRTPERDCCIEYIRKDAIFTADDLRRAYEIALLMAELKLRVWSDGVDAREYPMTAKVIPTLVDTTIKVLADIPPPDDLPTLVKGASNE